MKYFKHMELNKIILVAFVESSPTWMENRSIGSPGGQHFVSTAQLSHLLTGIALNCQEHKTRLTEHDDWEIGASKYLIHSLWLVLPVRGAPAKGHSAPSILKGC